MSPTAVVSVNIGWFCAAKIFLLKHSYFKTRGLISFTEQNISWIVYIYFNLYECETFVNTWTNLFSFKHGWAQNVFNSYSVVNKNCSGPVSFKYFTSENAVLFFKIWLILIATITNLCWASSMLVGWLLFFQQKLHFPKSKPFARKPADSPFYCKS